ncbi:N,N-dimethylformamidase beta subunit family domain-containing protein [Lentzea sp. NPDC059081]|uniref:N,N-dimethylformamidase beta subunit family domain-containing protein n=1 Tax=Lentzea sp. NPDC059081 TaxID=3346719 RepID=UPI0036C3319D
MPGGNGIIYALYADGRLKWFKHLGRQSGTYDWADGNGREIGSGWQIHPTVLASQDGQLFGFCGDGTLWWHKWVLTNPATGEGYWAPGTNNVIHTGFGQYSYVFGGWDGVFYAVDAHGDMYWFRYLAGDGSNGPGAWANNGVGQKIASEKRDYDMFFADETGVIYGIRHGAALHWFRYLAQDGSNGPGAWANGGAGIPIGSGWDFGSCVERVAERGVFYAVWVNRDHTQPDHELRWYRLGNWETVDQTGGAQWVNGDGALVGTGFTVTRGANLQGCANWSVAPGQTLDVAVSTTFDSFTASVLRLTGPIEHGGATQVWSPRSFAGRRHLLRSGYRANGPAWPSAFSVTVPDDWQSGFHVVKLEGPHGLRQYIPFVVKPKQPRHDVALLLPYLTHNAYNHWGGHFQYSWEPENRRRQISTRRPFANAYVEAPGFIDVRFYGDLLLMKWFSDNNIAYDCYQDLDLHDPSWLAQYKALVLATHPEYWTPEMRDAVETYLANGGRVIYTGGNSMYERVDYDASGGFVLHRHAQGHRWLWRDQGRPESQVLGVAYDSYSYMDMHPYEVDADHPFLEGTGLRVGDRFGETGYNFAASGWEVDTRAGAGPEAPGVVRFAHGVQHRGAEMCVLPKPNGGWVFSAGSLCFNGALAHDPRMSRILRNVVQTAQA